MKYTISTCFTLGMVWINSLMSSCVWMYKEHLGYTNLCYISTGFLLFELIVITQLGCLCVGFIFVRMCVGNFLFALGLLPRMKSLRGLVTDC